MIGRLLRILGDMARHPLQWIAVLSFIGSMYLFLAFWRGRAIVQILLFPLVIPAMFIMAYLGRIRR